MPDLLYEKFERYAVFTMNRPERLNAIGGTMAADLREALIDFTADPRMRAGILTGAGRAFCAGADLKERAESSRNKGSGEPKQRRSTLESAMPFGSNPKPFIAAINGICVAGGFERAMDCDIRICSTEAYFGLFEARRGIMPGYAVHHMSRLVPYGEAMYAMLTADRISTDQVLRWGLVTEVLGPGQLMNRAIDIAAMIADNAPLSIEGIKAIGLHWRRLAIDESYRLGEWVSRTVLESEDAKEGSRAFADKRPPVWKGR